MVGSDGPTQENSINLGESKAGSTEVSFNTLLNDSNLDFEPEKEAKTGHATSKRDFLTASKDSASKPKSSGTNKVTAGVMSMIGQGSAA